MFTFKCRICNKDHDELPSFGADFPEPLRAAKGTGLVEEGKDYMIDSDRNHYVRGRIEIPILGEEEVFTWLSWVSLSQESFDIYRSSLERDCTRDMEPRFGWHCSEYSEVYELTTINLKCCVFFQGRNHTPIIDLEPTDHPLSIEQRAGIDRNRVVEIIESILH